MSTRTGTDTFARFVEVFAGSLDDHETSGEALAACLHLSRFHFDRLVSAAAGEPPAASPPHPARAGCLPARRLGRGRVGGRARAGYSSHEAFTRAFARAYGRSPSQWRRRPTSFQLLARVPVAGEWLHIPRFRARIERVDWSEDGRVVVRLQTASVDASYLEELEQAGWKTFPRHDAATGSKTSHPSR